MPAEIAQRAARGGDNVDVRSVRRNGERGRRARTGTPERGTRERQTEQRVREIVHSVLDPVLSLLGSVRREGVPV